MTYRRVTALLCGILLALVTSQGLAATLRVTWTHPTTFTDGTPLTVDQIANTRIEYGDCDGTVWGSQQGEILVAAPVSFVQITMAGWGTKCARGYTRATEVAGGQESVASNIGAVNVPPPVPNPPTMISVERLAYEIKLHPNEGPRLGRAVGTVPLGTACGNEMIVWGGYYEVSPELVDFQKAPHSAIVVVRCAEV